MSVTGEFTRKGQEIFFDETIGRKFYYYRENRRLLVCTSFRCNKREQNNGKCSYHGAIVKTCEVQDCKNKVQNSGKCASHGAVRYICREPLCDKKVQNNGLCVSHGATRLKCKVLGCEKRRVNNGKCAAHGARRIKCKILGCSKKVVNNGKCTAHGAKRAKCKILGCKTNAVQGGKCHAHGAPYPKSAYCRKCEIYLVRRGNTKCFDCRVRGGEIVSRQERQEFQWLSKMESWGYFPSVHDSVIKDANCNVVNRRRSDFLFVTGEEFPYHILVECDEHSHGGHDVSCEMTRLQDIHDQLIHNSASIKPIVTIRFNPDSKEDIEDELRSTLDYAFDGTIDARDVRGIVVHKLIGYGEKRAMLYEGSDLTKRLEITDVAKMLN